MGEAVWFGCRDYLAVPHEKLFDDINAGPGVPAADPARQFLDELRVALLNAQTHLLRGLDRLKEGWEGDAAERADGAIRVLREWTDTTVGLVAELRGGIDAQVDHYVRAVRAMPTPVPVTATDTAFTQGLAGFFGLTTDRQEQEAAAREAHTRAAAVMDTYAASTFDTLVRMPRLEPPPVVVVEVEEPDAAAEFPARDDTDTSTDTSTDNGTDNAESTGNGERTDRATADGTGSVVTRDTADGGVRPVPSQGPTSEPSGEPGQPGALAAVRPADRTADPLPDGATAPQRGSDTHRPAVPARPTGGADLFSPPAAAPAESGPAVVRTQGSGSGRPPGGGRGAPAAGPGGAHAGGGGPTPRPGPARPGERADSAPGERRAGGAEAEETWTTRGRPGQPGGGGADVVWLPHVPAQWRRDPDGEHRSRFVVDAEARLFEDPTRVAPAVIEQDPRTWG
ncbi:PPE domain-containing protein [Streptoalloteichus hindustanus]|uniref:PPE-repeat protein n=1 Tax=Streptoalloteichus hindustanus TaxID=2017 RepID=A0A1M5PZR7_STRHI|nr:PPE domain-containing protein [Streptoalloteichus hindustanus]SHH07365.1 PPE-repeat protein [Streptoalloteichus hindustanus]